MASQQQILQDNPIAGSSAVRKGFLCSAKPQVQQAAAVSETCQLRSKCMLHQS